jgi:hypothetical protein
MGPAGPQGSQGPQGDTGPQGPAGPAGTISGVAAPAGDLFVLGAADPNLPNAVANPSAYFSPDVQPLNPGTLDDEFNGPSLDAGRWTWHNQGSATATVSNRELQLYSPAHSGTNWEYITQPAPSAPWTVRVKVMSVYPGMANYSNCGIVLSDSTGNIIAFSLTYAGTNNGLALGQTVYYNGATSYNGTPQGGWFGYMGTWYYMQVQDDGTNLNFSVSYDGLVFYPIYSASRTAFLASGPTLVGVGVDAENGSDNLYGQFGWFRRTQ